MILDIAMAETTPPPSTAASTLPDAKANTEILPSSSYSQGPIGGRGGRSGRGGRGSIPVSLDVEMTETTLKPTTLTSTSSESEAATVLLPNNSGGHGAKAEGAEEVEEVEEAEEAEEAKCL